ncbi:hypothetical protein GGTG_13337 [Gaeumannomyces tritici R3-111a-1]|uniref:Uncharacterized protein n=1 Tax=Gaeumannomyces tritici (strain R3-111a-1) TaxID=644352 RepID=J3PIK8_GAET3|nr:hypothetical protein GGTG_13337 [Gaeumannomyces tritici R3-111a-1]EJT69069.1 hypothetical protein GGTG_13337 [Gaeumannomyces tritici R3-111a-1]
MATPSETPGLCPDWVLATGSNVQHINDFESHGVVLVFPTVDCKAIICIDKPRLEGHQIFGILLAVVSVGFPNSCGRSAVGVGTAMIRKELGDPAEMAAATLCPEIHPMTQS